MNTETLNEYIFAKIVNERAFRLYLTERIKLNDRGLSDEKAFQKLPSKDAYFAKAISILNYERDLALSALEASKEEHRE